jgi:hypothetical protein
MSVEDYIAEDNPARCIDAFVDSLDLGALGFRRPRPAATGRPAYEPSAVPIEVFGHVVYFWVCKHPDVYARSRRTSGQL